MVWSSWLCSQKVVVQIPTVPVRGEASRDPLECAWLIGLHILAWANLLPTGRAIASTDKLPFEGTDNAVLYMNIEK